MKYNKRILSIVLVLVLVLSNITVFASKTTLDMYDLEWVEGPFIGEVKNKKVEVYGRLQVPEDYKGKTRISLTVDEFNVNLNKDGSFSVFIFKADEKDIEIKVFSGKNELVDLNKSLIYLEDHTSVEEVKSMIDAIPMLDDIRLDHKEIVEEARLAYDLLSDLEKDLVGNIRKLIDAEDMIAALEDESTVRPDIYLYSPDLLGIYNKSSILFEGYVTNFKYLDKVLIGNVEADFEYVKYVELRHPDDSSKILYTGPAFKFSETLEMADKYHAISVKAISKSGASGNIARRFYVDTTAPILNIEVEERDIHSDKANIAIKMNDNFGYLSLYLFDSNIFLHDALVRGDYNYPKERVFTENVSLDIGDNEFIFTLKDAAGNETVKTINIFRGEPIPVEKGNVQISLMKDSSDKVDFDLIKDSFYIKNKVTGEEFTEGNYLSSSRKDVYQMKGIPVGEYTIHYELPQELSTKKLQLGGAYKETDYDAELNPLVVEKLGSKSYNYVKITIKAEVLLKEIKDMDDLILLKTVTYDEFWATRPNTTIIVDENDIEHEVEVRLSVNKYNFEAGRDKGSLRIESDAFQLPLSVSNTDPAMRLRTWISITFEEPVPPVVIESLVSPATVEVKVGDQVTMPATVTANMSDGSTEELPVTWNPAGIDTSTAGTKTAVGTVEGYEGTVTFTVVVKEAPVSTDPRAVAVYYNKPAPDFNNGTWIKIDVENVENADNLIVKYEKANGSKVISQRFKIGEWFRLGSTTDELLPQPIEIRVYDETAEAGSTPGHIFYNIIPTEYGQ